MLQNYPDDPQYSYCDVALLMLCAERVAIHTKEHGYTPNYILLKDEEYEMYLSFYKEPKENPTFLGIPVKTGKA